jgi:catechol 2,3-dioxygenase-like lactoylglutathione lyase family enzyme
MEVHDQMFTEAFPILTTRDLPRLLGFYQGLLGFAETYRFPTEGRPAYVGLQLGSPACQLGIGEEADPAAGPVPAALAHRRPAGEVDDRAGHRACPV